ncbi:MAG: hypothetical protein KF729_08000 [Sandaracinaceae bacterium]|nr:hypothetical protein [Sandaracinaceae bacterium]
MPRLVVVLIAALALGPARARADERPLCRETPSDVEVRGRLALVRAYVRAEEAPARRWYTTFLFLHGAMAAGSIMLAASGEQNDGQRVDMTVNAISSTLAVLTMITATPPMIGVGGTLDAMPDDSPEQRLAKLRVAEDALRREANAIAFVDSWLPATGTALYTTAASSTLLLGFDRLGAAYTTIFGGIVLGHGRLLLRPRGTRGRWRAYRDRFPDAACDEAAAPSSGARYDVGLVGLGLGLTIQF